ncbi:MAG: ribosome rescue protein RqcH [Candidatus Aenigmatarchaeota archaeon]
MDEEKPVEKEQEKEQEKEERTKNEITSLDLRFIMKELKELLVGGLFRKIYQYGDAKSKRLFFEVYMPEKGNKWLFIDSNKLFITDTRKPSPQEPPSFCMFLRKHLMNKKIIDVKQHDFDRIIEIYTEDNILILELFSKGNVILTDTKKKIIMPLEMQKWKDREIRPKVPYEYPPRKINPFGISFDVIMTLLKKGEKKLISMLASDLGFGAIYASEICIRAELNEDTPTGEISIHKVVNLHRVIEDLDKIEIEPCIYKNTVSPFPLRTYNFELPEKTDTFSEALDRFFTSQMTEEERKEEQAITNEVKDEQERILEQQQDAKDKWSETDKESKEIANAIYNNYSTVESILTGLKKARDSGIDWKDLKEKIKSEQTPEAEAIKEIREGDAAVVVSLDGKDIELDIRKTVEENAASYYEESKHARGKATRTESAIGKTESAIEQLEREDKERAEQLARQAEHPTSPAVQQEQEAQDQDQIDQTQEDEEQSPEKKTRKKWYEKFRWFFSSDGFLVIAGRSADQNEMILKKHTDSTDIVFHADIPGAAFVVIKGQGMEPPHETIKEAAEFSAANSKAWSKGLGTVDVFCVPRAQVSKSPPSGQHLPKGSFMVTGERIWFRDMELKVSVGVKIEDGVPKAIAGPVMAMRKNSKYFVTIRPGFKKSLDLSKAIKNKLLIKANPEDKNIINQVNPDEFQVLVPSGTGEIVEVV